MSIYKQIVSPILSQDMIVRSGGKVLTDWLGWCLAVTQTQFGVAPFAANAFNAWGVSGGKHANYDLPEGVWVTIFWDGVYNGSRVGHVAAAKRTGNQVEIWSSPRTHKPYFDIYKGELVATINKMISLYSMQNGAFLGWTEYLNNVQIVAVKNEEPVPEPQPEPEPIPEPEPEPAPEPEPEPEPEKHNLLNLPEPMYEILRWLNWLVLPAIGVLITTLNNLWHWNLPLEAILGSISAVSLFFGTILGLAKINHD